MKDEQSANIHESTLIDLNCHLHETSTLRCAGEETFIIYVQLRFKKKIFYGVFSRPIHNFNNMIN